MKILLIISVLGITTIVYGINLEKLKRFYGYIDKCVKEKNATPKNPTPEVLLCALHKNGNVLDANGAFIREDSLKAIEDGISDPNTLQNAHEIYNKCHDEANQSGVTGHEQAIKIAGCSLPILALFDKL